MMPNMMMGGMMMPNMMSNMMPMQCKMTCEMTKDGMVCKMMPMDASMMEMMGQRCEMMKNEMSRECIQANLTSYLASP